MQKRTIEEVLIYKLAMNPMRSNTETAEVVATSYNRQALVKWRDDQLADEPWEDEGDPSFSCHGDSHTWFKWFKKGSDLEWYNGCDLDKIGTFGHGIHEEWVVNDERITNYHSETGIPMIY